MADTGEIDRILRENYGQGFQSPALNSGDGEIASTPDVLAQYNSRHEGLPGVLRGWAGNVRAASRPDNVLAGGLDTAANWIAGTPQVGQDTLAPLGLGIMGSMVAPANAAGIFGGRLARTADREALSRAEEMAGRGVGREDIWNQTGWFQGVDGKWRFEIDDRGMTAAVPINQWLDRGADGSFRAPNLGAAWDVAASSLRPEAPMRMRRLFEHPELERAYPHGVNRPDPQGERSGIMDIPLGRIEEGDHNVAGFMQRERNGRGQTAYSVALNEALLPGQARSTALHELQHVIQQREGFAPGSNADFFKPDVLRRESFENYSRQIQELMAANAEAASAYRARNQHQARMRDNNLTDDAIDELMRLDEVLARTPEGRRLQELDFERRRTDLSPPAHWEEQARDRYHRSAGEIESRNVQARRDFSPEARRAVPPWKSQDVPDADQILRQYGPE